MKNIVSIIIPVYNVVPYFRQCMDTVLKQTYEALEIILVDDGSTDGSEELCDRYTEIDRRVKVIHKENGGQSSARNCGLDQATGKWIMFIDSDDCVADNLVQRLVDVIGNHNMAMCTRTDFETEPIPSSGSGKLSVIDCQTALHQMFNDNQYIVVWGKLYRRELFTNFRFREGIIYEDEDALPQLIYEAGEIVYLQEQNYYYRVRPGSTMHSTFGKKQLDIIGVCERRIELFAKWGLNDLRDYAVKDYYYHLKRLENQTKEAGMLPEYEDVVMRLKNWKKLGVRFGLIDKLKQLLGNIRF